MRWVRNGIVLVGVLSVLLAGAWQFYQDPRLQELFHAAPARNPQPIRSSPPATHADPSGPARAASPGTNSPAPARVSTEPPPVQRSPNDVVSRVLFQVLGARKIAAGVSIEVTDSTIRVAGEVDSEDTRGRILSLVERASEGRSVDSAALVVAPGRDHP